MRIERAGEAVNMAPRLMLASAALAFCAPLFAGAQAQDAASNVKKPPVYKKGQQLKELEGKAAGMEKAAQSVDTERGEIRAAHEIDGRRDGNRTVEPVDTKSDGRVGNKAVLQEEAAGEPMGRDRKWDKDVGIDAYVPGMSPEDEKKGVLCGQPPPEPPSREKKCLMAAEFSPATAAENRVFLDNTLNACKQYMASGNKGCIKLKGAELDRCEKYKRFGWEKCDVKKMEDYEYALGCLKWAERLKKHKKEQQANCSQDE